MKYQNTCEHLLPVMIELTYEDLTLIQRMAKNLLDFEKLPEDHGFMFKGDIRKLEREARDALNKVSEIMSSSYNYPKINE